MSFFKIVIRFLSIVALAFTIVSCDSKSSDTKQTYSKEPNTGLEILYRYKSDSKRSPQTTDKLLLRVKFYNEKDSLMFDSQKDFPRFIMEFIKPEKPGATINDAYGMMHEGDSISVLINAHSFFRSADKNSEMLKKMSSTEKLRFEIKLVQIYSHEDFIKETAQIVEGMCEEEKTILKDFITQNYPDLKASKTGVFFKHIQVGKGDVISSNDSVTIHYNLSYINGELIYSSLKKNKPLTFKVSDPNLWPCLAESVLLMRKGSRAVCISPSPMAAGERGDDIVPPCKSVIFEIEILGVKKNK